MDYLWTTKAAHMFIKDNQLPGLYKRERASGNVCYNAARKSNSP